MKFDEMFAYLFSVYQSSSSSKSKSTSTASAEVGSLDKTHLDAIEQVLDRWPSSTRFPRKWLFHHNKCNKRYWINHSFITILLLLLLPLVIDLSRLICAYCPSLFTSDPNVASQFFKSLLRAAEWCDGGWDEPMMKERQTNSLLLLRTFVNVFCEELGSTGRDWEKWGTEVFEELEKTRYEILGGNLRVTLATLLFKWVWFGPIFTALLPPSLFLFISPSPPLCSEC